MEIALHPMTYFDEEYSNLQQAVSDLNSYLLYISDLKQEIKEALDIISKNTKITKEEYNQIVESLKRFLDSSKDFSDNYNSIIEMFKKVSGDIYER
jgi:methyl-accepting chemotaxis protein